MALILRSSKNFPLTNEELDGNFIFLNDQVNLKLSEDDFTPAAVLAKLNAADRGEESNIDASLLRGLAPTDVNTANSIVKRDANRNFAANVIVANQFQGKATDADHADEADVADTLSVTLPINKGGTAGITAAEARSNLGVVNIDGDTMTGKLILPASNSTRASLNVPSGAAPSTANKQSGDLWSTTSGFFVRLGTTDKQFAFTDSNITGTASNVTGIVSLVNGGTGANTAANARANLGAAARGVNSDITRLTGLTTPLSPNQGGTGLQNPGKAGNFLMSTGSAWESRDLGIPLPPAAIMAFYRTTAPAGWLECNGAAVSRTTYADLWNAMGNPNTGNGTTTFNLPDLRGEFVRGWDHSRGVDAGRALGSTQVDRFKDHRHDLKGDKGTQYYVINDANVTPPDTGATLNQGPDARNDGQWYKWTGYVDGSDKGGTETRPRNIALMYCIKI